MIKLNEAYNLRNLYTKMIEEALMYVVKRAYCFEETEIHKKSEVCSDIPDETKIIKMEKPFDFEQDEMLDFLLYLIDQNDILISQIQTSLHYDDYNEMLTKNIYKRRIVNSLYSAVKFRPRTNVVSNRYANKFDVDGRQTQYSYEVVSNETPLYNKEKLHDVYVEMRDLIETNSRSIENKQATIVIDFDPVIKTGMDLEEAFEHYKTLSEDEKS